MAHASLVKCNLYDQISSKHPQNQLSFCCIICFSYLTFLLQEYLIFGHTSLTNFALRNELCLFKRIEKNTFVSQPKVFKSLFKSLFVNMCHRMNETTRF